MGYDFIQMISGLKHEGRTIFLSTHNMTEAESLCDRIAVIKTKLVILDTPSGLQNRLFKRAVVVEMDRPRPDIMGMIQKLDFVVSIRTGNGKLVVEIENIDKNRPILIKSIVEAGGMVQNVYEEKHSLEEVYLSLIKDHENDS